MKDGTNTDMLRGAVSTLDPEISEWGNPIILVDDYLSSEFIAAKR